MEKPFIKADGANETTFITIIDVNLNVILMACESLNRLNFKKYDSQKLSDSLNVFLEELIKQRDSDPRGITYKVDLGPAN